MHGDAEGRRRRPALRSDGVERGSDGAAIEAALDRRREQPGGGHRWLWARPESARLGRRAVRRRSGPDVARRRRRRRHRGAQPRAARRSAAARAGVAGVASRRRRGSRRSSTCSASHATMPDDLGLFLDTHLPDAPGGVRFISEVAYDDRLESAPGLERQIVDGDRRRCGSCPSSTKATAHDRDAEAEAVAALVDRARRHAWTDQHGDDAPARRSTTSSWSRPYNAHVAELQRRAARRRARRHRRQVPGPGGRGRDLLDGLVVAPTTRRGAWTSCTTCTASTSPVSRARARAYIVASPELLRVLCSNAEATPARQRALSIRRIRRCPRRPSRSMGDTMTLWP